MTHRHAELLLFVVAIIAATGWILSKSALREFAPYTFIALRFTLAGLVLAVFCLPGLLRLPVNQVLKCLAVGAALGCGLLTWVQGLQITDNVGEGAFIVSLSVVTVPLIGRLFFAHKITPVLLVSLIPAISGLFFLSRDNLEHGQFIAFETSQLLFLFSTISFALHLNLSSYFVRNIPPLALTALQLAMVGAIAAIAALLFDPPFSEQGGGHISLVAWELLLASALIATSLRFMLQAKALQQLNPNHASMILLTEPVCTAFLGVWLLGDRMSGNQTIGCVLILAGLFIYRGVPLLKGRWQ